MIVLREGFEHIVECKECGSLLEYNYMDLHYDKDIPDEFYIICPICNKWIWMKRNNDLEKMYKQNISNP